MRIPGFEVGEVWGQALNLPTDSPAWLNISHAYRNVIDHVRLMIKFEEWEKNRHRVMWDQFLERVERARSLNLKIVLSIDFFNTWHLRDPDNPQNYHRYIYLPRNATTTEAVAEITGLVDPWVLQVGNEPYAKTNMSTGEYANIVYDYVRGAIQTGWRGPILAQQTYEDRGHVADGWEWHVGLNPEDPDALIVEWTHGLLEGKHRHPRVLHGLTSVAQLRSALESNAWAGRRRPVGWRHKVWHDEVSPLGKEVHIHTQLGSEMVTEALHFFRAKNVPMTFLTMGGYERNWGSDENEGWGMNTDLINDLGQLSLGAEALYRFRGVPLPDQPAPPQPPPDQGDDGLDSLLDAQDQLDRAERRWGTRRGIRHAQRAIRHTEQAIEEAG